jgi:hypothetical protein
LRKRWTPAFFNRPLPDVTGMWKVLRLEGGSMLGGSTVPGQLGQGCGFEDG